MANIDYLWTFFIFFVLRDTARNVGAVTEESSTPRYTNGSAALNSTDVCDGKSTCINESRELDGQKPKTTLYYYAYKMYMNYSSPECCDYEKAGLREAYERSNCTSNLNQSLDMISLDLNNNSTYSVNAFTKNIAGTYSTPWAKYFPSLKNIHVTSSGLRANIFYTEYDTSAYIATTEFGGTESWHFKNATVRDDRVSFQNPVVDWLTSAVYVLSDSQIKLCDEYISFCIGFIRSKFDNPLVFTISSEQRLLFWVTQVTNSEFYLVKYPLVSNATKELSAVILRKDLKKSPKWLTVDVMQDRLCWMEMVNRSLYVHSTTFNGTDLKTINPVSEILSDDISSFAVFDGTVYWPDEDQKNIWKCSMNDGCHLPTIFRQISDDTNDQLRIGNLMIDHSSAYSTNASKVCSLATCSHMCIPSAVGEFNCYCQDASEPLPSNTTFCEDNTVIVTYENRLFTIGMYADDTITPIIREHTLNISVSAVAFNIIKEFIILTEVGRQNIYSWKPTTKKLVLILAGGPGTIKSIQFDDTANNLYWIDPVTSTLKMMAWETRLKVDLVAGNSTYVLDDFTLITSSGSMALLFVKNHRCSVVETFSMHGEHDFRETLYEDFEANDIGYLSLHTVDSTTNKHRQLYLLDKQTNEMKFLFTNEEFRVSRAPKNKTKIRTISSLGSNFIWASDDDLVIHLSSHSVEFMYGVNYAVEYFSPKSSVKILQDLETGKNHSGILSMVSVEKSYVQYNRGTSYLNRAFACFENNGGCEELCVRNGSFGERSGSITCLCTEGKKLVNGTLCRSASEIVEITSERKSESNFTVPTGPDKTVEFHTELVTIKPKSDSALCNKRVIHHFSVLPMFFGIVLGFLFGYFRQNLFRYLRPEYTRFHARNNSGLRVELSELRRADSTAHLFS